MALSKDKPVDSKGKVMSSKAKFFYDLQASPPDLGNRELNKRSAGKETETLSAGLLDKTH